MNMHVDFDPLYNAPALILVSSKKMPFPNIEFVDAGCIMQNMMLEATEQGLGSVVIWGSSMVVNAVPDLKKALQIPVIILLCPVLLSAMQVRKFNLKSLSFPCMWI